MADIIVIEMENDSRLLEDVMEVIEKRTDCRYTYLSVEEKNTQLLTFPGLCIDLDCYTVITGQAQGSSIWIGGLRKSESIAQTTT